MSEPTKVNQYFTGSVLPWGAPRFVCKKCGRIFDFKWPAQPYRVAWLLADHLTDCLQMELL